MDVLPVNRAVTATWARRFPLLLSSVLILIGLSACAGSGYSASDIPDSLNAQPDEYRIGPGDGVQIFVWDHEDLSVGVRVRPDGRISTPLVEDLQAAGKTPTELARDIESVLSEYVRSPVVTVIMQGFEGAVEQQVRVVGQAAQPRSVPYKQGMTVLDVVIEVGGLAEFAAGNRSKVVRKINGESVEIRVRLNDLLNGGDMDENIRMLPGDVLIIPESIF